MGLLRPLLGAMVADHEANPGPKVANLSIGARREFFENSTAEQAVRDAIAAGIVVVVAAGNKGIDASEFVPARVDQAITVGATDAADARAIFPFPESSNTGVGLDLFAPGKEVPAAWGQTPTYSYPFSGTSAAAPYVAGIAARYLQNFPNAIPWQVQNVTRDQAHPTSSHTRGS